MIIRSPYVAPIEGPTIENGYVEVADGRIVKVGRWRGAGSSISTPLFEPEPQSRRQTEGRRGVCDLGDCVVLPGFVNAHTHLELTDYAGRLPAGDLWGWVMELVALRSGPGQRERERGAVGHGAALSLEAGVTTVGDISRLHLAWPVLKDSPLRAVCFAELLCFADEPARTVAELAEKVREMECDDGLIAGISPHAPYSVTAAQLRACVAMARQQSVPLTIHVAETPDERDYVERGKGRLYDMIAGAGYAAQCPPPRQPLFEYLAETGLFDVAGLLAHMNYVTDAELDRLAGSACSVAYCPRAHRFYGHEGHRFRDMLARGINVCVGTDSLAANESLSVLDELRFLRRAHRDLDAATLLAMGTSHGARALGLGDRTGALIPGRRADLVAIPLDASGMGDPLANVLESAARPCLVMIDGVAVREATR
jgi:cytosine/adenosine deaminase-related metal-dependent hydrolase